MSYSYIKSVFPNFENSNKVYDENLYNNINTLYTDSNLGLPKPENLDKPTTSYKKPVDEVYEIPPTVILREPKKEGMANVYNDYAPITLEKPPSQDNLTYYNTPLPTILAKTKVKSIEGFEERIQIQEPKTKCEDPDCDEYIKHILECGRCKAIAIKQLGVDNDRFRNEETMEIVSYVVFGLFILLLIDTLKTRERS